MPRNCDKRPWRRRTTSSNDLKHNTTLKIVKWPWPRHGLVHFDRKLLQSSKTLTTNFGLRMIWTDCHGYVRVKGCSEGTYIFAWSKIQTRWVRGIQNSRAVEQIIIFPSRYSPEWTILNVNWTSINGVQNSQLPVQTNDGRKTSPYCRTVGCPK